MVGYGANKVQILKCRESSPFHANKYLPEFQKTMTTKNMRSTSPWWKSTTKKFKICWFPSLKDPKRVIKSESIRPLGYMWRECQSTLLTPMPLSRRSWRMDQETDQLPPLKWMPAQVGLILSFQLSLNKRRSSKTRRKRSCQSFTWLIWQAARKLGRLGPLEIDWRKLLVSTKVCQFSA